MSQHVLCAPGDLFVVKQDTELWFDAGTEVDYDPGCRNYWNLKCSELVMLLARCPDDDDWWVCSGKYSDRTWRDEQLMVLTTEGRFGWVVRQYLKRVNT